MPCLTETLSNFALCVASAYRKHMQPESPLSLCPDGVRHSRRLSRVGSLYKGVPVVQVDRDRDFVQHLESNSAAVSQSVSQSVKYMRYARTPSRGRRCSYRDSACALGRAQQAV